MNCYDCAIHDNLTRPAIGVCHDCGAAVCEHHAVTRDHHLTRTVPLMRAVPVEPAARLLRCTTCDAAHQALHSHTPPAARRATASTR